MRSWQIEPREFERHETRRDRRHPFERLEPAHTALVVIDRIPFFLTENLCARGTVPNIQEEPHAAAASPATKPCRLQSVLDEVSQ